MTLVDSNNQLICSWPLQCNPGRPSIQLKGEHSMCMHLKDPPTFTTHIGVAELEGHS